MVCFGWETSFWGKEKEANEMKPGHFIPGFELLILYPELLC